jgi:hypothetical protein
MYILTIKIPRQPVINNETLESIRARLVYLETPECRNTMSKIRIDAERKLMTEKFKEILAKRYNNFALM